MFIRKFDDHNIDHLWTFSDVESITCLPEQGNISVSAGQIEGWTRFYITAEFIEENRCTDPCSTSTPPRGGTAVCRSSEDLQILTMKELDRQFEGLLTNKRQRRNDNIGWFYINVGLLLFPYIICQGVWAVCFWRKTPGQVRYVIFAAFKKIGLPRIVAKAWATLCYLAALFILVLSPPLFVLSLVTAETFLSPFPEGGGYDSLDAWGPWVGVALALVAALVAWGYETYHGRNDGSKIKAPLFSTRRWREGGEERDEMETRSIASSSRRARNALDRMKNEWKEFVAFWRDPDDAGVSRPHSTPRFHGRLERALIADEEERYGPNKPYGSVEMVGFTR